MQKNLPERPQAERQRQQAKSRPKRVTVGKRKAIIRRQGRIAKVNIIEYNMRKWNQEKEIKKRVILVEKMVEK